MMTGRLQIHYSSHVWRRLGVLALFCAAARAQSSLPVIIDTDAGSDDLMAIAFLLGRRDVQVEAITVVNGLAHVGAGARNIARLLELAGRREIPVYAGRPEPLEGRAEFPARWRRDSDRLPGVHLPVMARGPEAMPAAKFLAGRKNRARILALGPLTNLAEALALQPAFAQSISEIVIMGGAIHARGNLDDGGFFKTTNKTAEWNIFVDPRAAAAVFASGVPIRLVPLDATNKVKIDAAFLTEYDQRELTPLGRFVREILATERASIEGSYYYAWDPLAAAALVEPEVIKTSNMSIAIRLKPPEVGRTAETPGGKVNAAVAMDADARMFKKLFLDNFARK
jgi:pyrimidine-specific ribonucleoside hydrolase